jgi:hypothetical protein
VWSAVALVGFMLNAWALWDAYGDRAALRRRRLNGARLIVANGNVRREWFRVFKQGCFLAIGAFFALTRPAGPPQPLSAAGVVLVAGLLAAIVSMVVASAFDRAERARLLERLARERAHEAGT